MLGEGEPLFVLRVPPAPWRFSCPPWSPPVSQQGQPCLLSREGMLDHATVSSQCCLLGSSPSLHLPRQTQEGHRELLETCPGAPLAEVLFPLSAHARWKRNDGSRALSPGTSHMLALH